MSINPWILLSVLLVEVVSLYLFSRLLTQSLARIFYYLTRSQHQTIQLLALLLMPGTLIHELSHILIAGVTLVPVGDISITPRIEGDKVKLGTAEVGESDPIRRALIGVAPVIVGLGLIVGSLHFLGFTGLWSSLILLYIIFIIANTMFSSPKDLEGTIEVVILIVSILIALYFLGFLDLVWISQRIFTSGTISVLNRVVIYLLIPIIVDLGVYSLAKVFLRNKQY